MRKLLGPHPDSGDRVGGDEPSCFLVSPLASLLLLLSLVLWWLALVCT